MNYIHLSKFFVTIFLCKILQFNSDDFRVLSGGGYPTLRNQEARQTNSVDNIHEIGYAPGKKFDILKL